MPVRDPLDLRLDDADPRVAAARDAERRLFAVYGLEARTHFIPLPESGLRLRVLEIGSGKPIVVVPGNTGDVFPLASLLAQFPQRRILAVNRPGGGLSEGMDHRAVDLRSFAVQTLTAVFNAFALDRAPVIAHSMGGHWSLWLAMDRPERVSALTLLGAPGNVLHTRPPLALRLLALPGLNGLLFDRILSQSRGQSLRSLTFMGHPAETLARQPAELGDCYFHFQNLPHYRISSLSLMQRTSPLSDQKPAIRITADQLRQVRQPVLFLWGERDPFGSVAVGQEIARQMPDAAFHALPRSGHLPWLDDPDTCGRLAREFFDWNE
jgi:pimeloyl-ACP methyl ester carboxylesterase